MGFLNLDLWKQEEIRIHKCLENALLEMTKNKTISESEIEDGISGELYPYLLKARKLYKLIPTVHRQMAIYEESTDPKPIGYPDFGFCWNDSELNQIEYHVECKRLSYKNWVHCYNYVSKGIKRYQDIVYANDHHSGAMIGYVQKGGYADILKDVNNAAVSHKYEQLSLESGWITKGVTRLNHKLYRPIEFSLTHFWVDFR